MVLATALCAKTSAAAPPLPVAVRISESLHEGCPTAPGMGERLEAHLAHIREARPDEPAIDLAVRVERRGAVSHGTLELSFSGVSVHRSAASTSCEDVVGALSLMAAIAIGEEAERLASHGPEEASVAEPPPAPASPPKSSARAARRPQRRGTPRPAVPRKRLSAALGAGFEVNGNRNAVLMGAWFAQLTLPAPLDPTVRVGAARSTREPIASSRGVVAIRWSELTAAGCVDVLREPQLRVGPCFNAEVGLLEASVVVPRPAVDASYLWLSLGGAARIAWRPMPAFSVEMTLGARAPVLRKELFFEPYAEPVAYRAPAISPFIGLGFIAHLP
ncbi:MAG: hypothetical protein KF850_09280 [Labilithrix sp.]|nr:hypothetical protein [Labilithrix sp.]